MLELLDNKITPLGCEFISQTVHPRANTSLLVLKLDHNDFGSAGMRRLADGLSLNKTLTSLSLTYCNIDWEGSRALFEILIFTKSALEELNLTGNHLRNEGVVVVLRGLGIAKSLKKIYLTDNQFNEADDVLEAFRRCMVKNKTLGRYDLMYNNFSENGVNFFMGLIENEAKHVYELEFSERGLASGQIKELQDKLKLNKPRKGKKKGGKKKKKK